MAASIYMTTRELPRGLVSYCYGPLFHQFGCIAGSQENAIQAYKDEYNCICMPGGIEEAMQGFESSYKLIWKSSSGNERRGFARLALQANATIVPFGTRNGEEMFFNLIVIYGISNHVEVFFFNNEKSCLRCALDKLEHSCPVRAGIVFGKPIVPMKNESKADLAKRTKKELQELIDKVNPGGHSYMKALQ
ncbi:hypothetical protein THRCLA_09625 [Thraustotheca clavata]|uniref:Uncharacterized protein n=1 Tax=Thraustotheca clavata TaxID=74557 RepID=A0A1V9YVJ3_9STRA|nr:hypothetical protein THRCLA_09625 [Thraustotheca clavata]